MELLYLSPDFEGISSGLFSAEKYALYMVGTSNLGT